MPPMQPAALSSVGPVVDGAATLPLISLVVALVAYFAAVRLVNRNHPAAPVPRYRVAFWLAGLAVIGVALISPLDAAGEIRFSAHMVQHLLLVLAAPPLLALGAPVTLLMRATPSGVRRSIVVPVLHARIVRVVSSPWTAWIAFSGVMWATHFTGLFNAALEDQGVHVVEHLLYLASGALFWWPVIGADPTPGRLRPAGRMLYLAAQMPVNTAVGLAIYFAPTVLYAHYEASAPAAFGDQQVAGILMWGVGDTVLLGALVLAIAAWLRADELRGRRLEGRAG